MSSLSLKLCAPYIINSKSNPGLTQDIAYIYEILIIKTSTGPETLIDCGCLICSGIAENDEVVAVEDFINVGNILGSTWVALLLLVNL